MSFTEAQKQIMQDAIKTYGAKAQTDMMIEEMSELTKALLKLRRAEGNEDVQKAALISVKEEMADVEIVLEQMHILYGDSSRDVLAYKLNRLRKRIEEARNG